MKKLRYLSVLALLFCSAMCYAQNSVLKFNSDKKFKIVQFTDVHWIAGNPASDIAGERMNEVLDAEKPDLVVVTGDITYPVPFQAGTFNNKLSAKLFAGLMEQLGVYWCPVFGNHDTEAYSYYSREQISDIYSSDEVDLLIMGFYRHNGGTE